MAISECCRPSTLFEACSLSWANGLFAPDLGFKPSLYERIRATKIDGGCAGERRGRSVAGRQQMVFYDHQNTENLTDLSQAISTGPVFGN